MRKKWMGLMGAACMVIGMILPVQAAEEGSVRIIQVWGGQQIPGGEVILSRVGDRTGEGFRITDGLADWIISEQEIFSGDWTTWLQNQERNMIVRTVEEETGAFFEGVPEGLYLVQQNVSAPAFMAFRPFLLSIPEGKQWEILREVPLIYDGEPPQTGDRHVPLIGAMGIGLSAAILMVLADQRKK